MTMTSWKTYMLVLHGHMRIRQRFQAVLMRCLKKQLCECVRDTLIKIHACVCIILSQSSVLDELTLKSDEKEKLETIIKHRLTPQPVKIRAGI